MGRHLSPRRGFGGGGSARYRRRVPPIRLVLVPGTRFNTAVWEPYRALLPGIDVVAVDLPGHGTRAGEAFTTDAARAVIEAAVAAREPGQRVVVAGHSLGGYMAMLWAQRTETPPDALVLFGASADPSSRWAGLYRGFARLLPVVGAERMARALNALMRALGARGPFAAALPDGTAYAALPAAWSAVITECGPHLLEDLDCPVLLANGRYDQMRAHVGRYAAAARRPYVVTIPGATHLFPVTHPEHVAEVLRTGIRLARHGRPPVH